MIRRFLFLILFFLLSLQVKAAPGMRRCMLLPIQDPVGGAIGFKVFENLESFLKDSEWCYFRPNSEIINVLGNYKKNLSSHLNNKDVLKVIAEKTKAGSLIRVVLKTHQQGIQIEMEVIGANGGDVYFKEKTILNSNQIELISQVIQDWLGLYSKTIPYDARVTGVLGDQFTMDIGTQSGSIVGAKLFIQRPIRKKKHPLLKEIVEWETEEIGIGKIFHATVGQSQGKMLDYEGRKKLKINDWVLLAKEGPVKKVDQSPFVEGDEYKFGKLGQFGLFLDVASGSATRTLNEETEKKIGGLLFGVRANAEIWATRNFWAGLDFGRKFGSFKKKEGTLNNESNSVENGIFKFVVGYKYLPLGFFYGPQVDGYLGYGDYSYGLDTQVSDGFTKTSFKGLLLGTRGSIPLYRAFSAYLQLDFLLGSKYTEETTIYGEDESSSTYSVALGLNYRFSPTIFVSGDFSITSSSAEFENPTPREIRFKETGFKIGTKFLF